MLEPASLHQTGFKVPGLLQDARGVVVSTHAALLLLGLDKVVSLLRLLSEEQLLTDVLPSLRIEQVRNDLQAQAYFLWFQCADSQQLDRYARAGRLTGATLLVGAGQHFVAYRDRRSPLGYDAQVAAPRSVTFLLYTDAGAQAFARVRELQLTTLLRQLMLIRLPGGARTQLRSLAGAQVPDRDFDESACPSQPLLLEVPLALLPRMVRYLWQLQVVVEAVVPLALSELPVQGALSTDAEAVGLALTSQSTDEPPTLLRVSQASVAQLQRLLQLPGLRIYRQLLPQLAIELGFAHPLRLSALESLFDAQHLYLWRGSQRGMTMLRSPRSFPAERLLDLRYQAEPSSPTAMPEAPLLPREVVVPHGERPTAPVRVRISLQLRSGLPGQTSGPVMATATLVPWSKVRLLSTLLYLLPAPLLGELQAACIEEGVLVTGASGVASLALGTLLYEPAPGVLVPVGCALLPALPPQQLLQHLGGTSERVLVFLPEHRMPLALARSLFEPLSLQLLSPLSQTERVSQAASHQSAAVQLVNDRISTFALWPLWGRPSEDER